jgi:hypothetical protein
MPIWMRKAYIQYISDFHNRQNEEIDKKQLQNKPLDNKIHRPDINPQ